MPSPPAGGVAAEVTLNFGVMVAEVIGVPFSTTEAAKSRSKFRKSGVVVTVNQLGIVVGIAAFGSLYLNVAGTLPSGGGLHTFALASGHAYLWVSATLAVLAVAGAGLALAHGRAAVAAVAR